MNDCLWQWTSPALCPSALWWLISRSAEGGNIEKLKLDSSCSHCIRSKLVHKPVFSAWKWPLGSPVQDQYLPWSLEMSGLYQNLEVSWTNFTVSCLLPKSARHKLRLYVRFQTGFGPNMTRRKNKVRETLLKGQYTQMTNSGIITQLYLYSTMQVDPVFCAEVFWDILVWIYVLSTVAMNGTLALKALKMFKTSTCSSSNDVLVTHDNPQTLMQVLFISTMEY